MIYKKSSTIIGNWIKGSDLAGIDKAKIVSETTPQPSQFINKDGSSKTQDVCKIKFEGKDEVFNISLNKATINGLIDCFGDNSINWQNKVLSVETEKVRVGGVARVAIYLIPDGYERIDDENGYAMIVKIGSAENVKVKDESIPVIEEGEGIDVKDIPF